MGKRVQKPRLKTPRAASRLERETLLPLIRRNPERVLKVLHKHGVHFCAGCYLTLSSPVERVAAYHAVPRLKLFVEDLRRALED